MIISVFVPEPLDTLEKSLEYLTNVMQGDYKLMKFNSDFYFCGKDTKGEAFKIPHILVNYIKKGE